MCLWAFLHLDVVGKVCTEVLLVPLFNLITLSTVNIYKVACSFSVLPRILTVRFMKLRNFFSISVMMEKSPLGRCSRTVVTLICARTGVKSMSNYVHNALLYKTMYLYCMYLFLPGCLGTGSPKVEPCRRRQCCPPYACLHAAELHAHKGEKTICD